MTFEIKYHISVLAAALLLCFYLVRMYYSADRPRSLKVAKLLFFLKFLFLALFVFMIFDPVVIRTYDEEKNLTHLVLIDNSRSVALNDPGDSISFKNTAEKLIGQPGIVTYLFGERTRTFDELSELDFSDRFTYISTPGMKEIIEAFGQERSAASVTIITDANFTDASDISLRPGVPVNIIYPSVRKKSPDLFIENLYYNETVPSDKSSEFDLTVGYSGEGYRGDMTIKITSGDRLIKSINAPVPQPGTFSSHKISLPPPEHEYRETKFSVEAPFEERNLHNNTRTAYQRKAGQAGKLAILARNNSLDLAFLEKMLSENGYRFDTFFIRDTGDMSGEMNYRALITIGMFEENDPELANIISSFDASLHFTGPGTDTALLGKITGTGIGRMPYIPSEAVITKSDDGTGAYLFVRNTVRIDLSALPPVKFNSAFTPANEIFAPLAGFSKGPHASSPLYQKSTEGSNIMIANFSSFWKTALNDPGNMFESFILNIIDQASLDRSRDRILISLPKNEFVAGETAVFSGRILDDNLHPVTGAQASIEIGQAGFSAPFILRNRNYEAAVAINEPGIYDAHIKVAEGDDKIEKIISFIVNDNDPESSVLGTDTLAAKRFAEARGGELIHISGAEDFFESKKGGVYTDHVKNTSYPVRTLYYFLMLAGLFIAELTLRKYYDLS